MFLLGRDAEALDLAERSLRERPSFPGPIEFVQPA
jgi:hypothetical protein